MNKWSLAFLLFFLLPFSSWAQVVTKEDEKYIKEGIVRFLGEFETFINQIGNSNVSAEEKQRLIDQQFLRYFKNEEVTIEQDLNPKGRDRSVKVKPAKVYLNNIGVYYFNVAMHFDSISVKGIYRNGDDIFAIANFNRSYDAIDRNGEYLTSTTLPREAYFDLSKINDNWAWKLKGISFYEERNIDQLRIDIAQKDKFINIKSPVRGTKVVPGGGILIIWDDNITEDVRIELYNGNTMMQLIESSTASDGEYEKWQAPTNLIDGTSYKIKITSTVNANIFSVSRNFTIEKPATLSQEELRKPHIFFGLKGLFNYSYVSGNGLGLNEAVSSVGAGGFLGMNLSQNFSASIGLEKQKFGNQFTLRDSTEKLQLDYLRIPILFSYYPRKWDKSSIRYLFGPTVNLLQKATLNSQFIDAPENMDAKSQMNKVDVALTFGLGYNLVITPKARLVIDATYQYGLSNLFTSPIAGSKSFNSTSLFFNRGILGSLGVVFVP